MECDGNLLRQGHGGREGYAGHELQARHSFELPESFITSYRAASDGSGISQVVKRLEVEKRHETKKKSMHIENLPMSGIDQ